LSSSSEIEKKVAMINALSAEPVKAISNLKKEDYDTEFHKFLSIDVDVNKMNLRRKSSI
jgi:hypothetical protein